MTELHHCRLCGTDKPAERFYKRQPRMVELYDVCITCQRGGNRGAVERVHVMPHSPPPGLVYTEFHFNLDNIEELRASLASRERLAEMFRQLKPVAGGSFFGGGR